MNGAVLLLAGIVFFVAAYFTYGRYLRGLFGIDPDRPTPANVKNDGMDYVPAKPQVLFGHHFASIAGAGPIVGPVLGAYLGWVAVALWIFIGCVFIGALHDFASLFLSVRDEGRSIGHIIERQLGYAGRQIFLLFSWTTLILVVAIFAVLVAGIFVKMPEVATASLCFVFMAPIFGYLVYKKGLSIGVGSIVFVPLMFVFIWGGTKCPMDLTVLFAGATDPAEAAKTAWLAVLLVYVFVASVLPVWLLLQPRDYLNSYLLYAMMIAGIISIFIAAPHFNMPAFTGWVAEKPKGGMGSLFPILYVTVACGAISGFHALVASGTTAKQIATEKHMLPIGYGAMLVEGIVALMALTSVAILSKADYMSILQSSTPVHAFAVGLAGCMVRIHIPENVGTTFIAMSVSAFMLTTLDTATRLARFSWQELFLPKAGIAETKDQGRFVAWCSNPFVATAVVVFLAGYLAKSGNAWQIWPVFGASNQLLSALTLLIITLFLLKRKANFWVALIPMLFMMSITVWALIELVRKNLGQNNTLVIVSVFLLVMAMVLVYQSVSSLRIKADDRQT